MKLEEALQYVRAGYEVYHLWHGKDGKLKKVRLMISNRGMVYLSGYPCGNNHVSQPIHQGYYLEPDVRQA